MTLRTSFFALALALGSLGFSGCGPKSDIKSPVIDSEVVELLLAPPNLLATSVKQAPDANFKNLESGVSRANVIVKLPSGKSMALWIYQPDPLPSSKVPCVFIAPAGTLMIHGKQLASGDEAEHIPWVKAGFSVVAYELSGDPGSRDASNVELKIAAEEFRKAKSGLVNARVAMAYAKEKLSFVDPRRFYTAGHSSAGTMAMYVALMEPQVRAVAAFMPAVDVRAFFGPQDMKAIQQNGIVPNAGEYVTRISPSSYIDRISQPMFLAYVENDPGNTKPAEKFCRDMREKGKDITSLRIPQGDHYQSMIDDALPMGVDWLTMINAMR
ncbi:alpha/beta hydrolase family protein [Blastopirellula marina]|uniref:Peptidase S9 prolyl oligopeptidase catalytic domain-containing protein n=1 Tax=Blastopirellula marina TaxID=124 RepID=A0A2S8GQC0_9BACT|nr:prolyl oligopeptidase family serine peptidase [Blastopirellula marina]PQO46214.1 hypothetical protein C5Y93_09515 [Blastopirellula marina]